VRKGFFDTDLEWDVLLGEREREYQVLIQVLSNGDHRENLVTNMVANVIQ
jgi:hypothetical protein